MHTQIDYTKPDNSFWQRYTELWHESLYQPIFQAPHILQHFIGEAKNGVAIYKYFSDGQLLGTAFFQKVKGAYQFLSDMKTDHNFFVIHKSCSEAQIKDFFENFIAALKKQSTPFVLNSQPSWASYMPTFLSVAKRSKLFLEKSKVSVCPMLKTESAEALFSKLNKSKNNRYKMNRLKKEQAAIFEVFTDEEDLEEWINEFFQVHVERWKNTSTPSEFNNKGEQEFFKGCMRAWMEDRALVRFSIKIGERRIAFVIGLIQEDALLYHKLTYDTTFQKYSPGKVLILHLAHWMKSQNLKVLDFGYGDEEYKYRFANIDPDLHTIFLSPRSNYPFILKARIKKAIRENAKLIKFYREKIKPLKVRLKPN